jgi:hypothetical protein
MPKLQIYSGKEWIEIAKNGKDAIVDYDYILSKIPKPVDGKDGADGFVDEATIGYLEDEIKRVEGKITEKETNFGFVIRDVQAGSGVTIDKKDPNRPVISASGGSTEEVIYTPSSLSLIAGTLNDGTVADVQTLSDGNVYDVQEVAGVPGYNIEFNFTSVDTFTRVWVHELYTGSGSHTVNVDLWNYNTSAWDTITTFTTSVAFYFIDLPVTATNYVSSGNAKLRLYHISSGNASHRIQVDYVALVKAGVETTPANCVEFTFETVSKNLDASDATFTYTGDELTSITYSNGVTKTFTYTGDNLTSVVLSGNTPDGIDLTKTLTYTGDNLTGIAFL